MSNTNDFEGINALLSRAPGYSVAQKCLEVQADAEQLDPRLRANDKVQLHGSAWSWFMGAVGEIEVGRLLQQLGPQWFVRHAVPIGTGTTDVDHLLIGPAGVFALNTKHHRGQSVWTGDYMLKVNGANTDHLKIARSEAENVRRRLSDASQVAVTINSVLVLVGTTKVTDIRKSGNHNPAVVRSDSLVKWLSSQTPVLSDGELGLIRLAAEEPTTWHIDPHAADTFRVMQRFERLRSAVGNAPFAYTPPARDEPRLPSKTSRIRRPAPSVRPQSRVSARERKRAAQRTENLVKAILFLGVAAVFLIFNKPIMQAITSVFVNIATPNP